jgi:hypothetical protein
MITRKVVVRAKDVVLLKGIVEANEGLAQVFGQKGMGGVITIAAPEGRAGELDALLSDLEAELGMMRAPPDGGA